MWILKIQEQPTCPATPQQEKHTDRTEPAQKIQNLLSENIIEGPLSITEQT
jgi:hypothetical protein